MLPITIQTPSGVRQGLAARFKARRLALNFAQEGLAARSGVNWSSLKRFERTGLIALESLLKLALVLGCLEEFDSICVERTDTLGGTSLDQILARSTPRKKGRIK